jgi:hypothetical protein
MFYPHLNESLEDDEVLSRNHRFDACYCCVGRTRKRETEGRLLRFPAGPGHRLLSSAARRRSKQRPQAGRNQRNPLHPRDDVQGARGALN